MLTAFSFPAKLDSDSGPKQFLSKKQLKQFEKSYAYVPSGTLMLDKDREISVHGFYIFKTEISNLDYMEFIAHTKTEGDTDLLEKIQISPENWKQEAYEENYHVHPAYEEYPVLNINHEAAEAYCNWLSKMLANSYDIDHSKISVRLPTKEEWMYAAHGGHQLAPYPWGGYYIRNAKGCTLANFNQNIGTASITFNQENGKYEVVKQKHLQGALVPSPVKSYFPNDYGLYNMSGNVAEMIDEQGIAMGGSWKSTGYDIRIQAEYKYNTPTPYVGFRPIVIIGE